LRHHVSAAMVFPPRGRSSPILIFFAAEWCFRAPADGLQSGLD
jgi:hypothetical protein